MKRGKNNIKWVEYFGKQFLHPNRKQKFICYNVSWSFAKKIKMDSASKNAIKITKFVLNYLVKFLEYSEVFFTFLTNRLYIYIWIEYVLCKETYDVMSLQLVIWFLVFNTTFSYIMASSFSGGRSRSTRREPQTMGKQLVNFITCGCKLSAPFFGNLQSRVRTHAILVIGLYELLGNPTT